MFRPFVLMCVIAQGGWLISSVLTYRQQRGSIVELVLFQLLTATLHSLMALMLYDREMLMRKTYNEERILQVETERAEEAIGKLVPLHILEGIKNDQQIVDKLEHVTILFARLRCTGQRSLAFSHEYATMLKTLFGKFDMLCEMRQVYKVHSYGDVYVVMSYNGTVPKEKRYSNEITAEAYNTLLLAFDILEIAA